MMRSILAGAILIGCTLLCRAQYEGTAAAKALDHKGHDAEQNNMYAEALADFRQALALDSNYADAYTDEFDASVGVAIQARLPHANPNDPNALRQAEAIRNKVVQDEVKELENQARQHPDKPIYPWAMAQLYTLSDPLKMEQYCGKAVAVDEHFGLGYECLAAAAYMRSDDKEQSALLAKAAQLEPDKATVAAQYSQTLKDNPAAYKAATLALLEKFPADPEAAGALYYYAAAQKTEADEVEWLERLQRQFPPDKYLWGEMGEVELFRIEDHTDPAKARRLADDMARLKPQGDDWAEYTGYADAMATAEEALKNGHAAEAVAALKSVKAPYYGYDMRREVLLNAQALHASTGPGGAYAYLLDEYAEHPTDEVGAALEAYGAKLGKSGAEVHAAVWAAMANASTPAIPFTLPDVDGGKAVSLADYRGRGVVVEFWFPGCGPCRESFPWLEELVRKYKSRGVVVLAINGEKGMEPFVIPFLRSHGYDFLPLQADHDWDAAVYHVISYPTTFIIGADGRKYFHPRLINQVEQRSTELEIVELLAHSG
jgi:thiol-disulfide isomerase/thioredoxin